MSAENLVGAPEPLRYPDGYGLLSDAEVNRTADEPFLALQREKLLYQPNGQHHAKLRLQDRRSLTLNVNRLVVFRGIGEIPNIAEGHLSPSIGAHARLV
jgi:hypothetical protein